MAYIVRPSKGDFLLFTVMNLAGYNENDRCSTFHPLRAKTREHFAKEINNPHVLDFYNLWLQRGIHNHPPWNTLVDIQKTELGEPVSNDQNSAKIRETLAKFAASVGFDDAYQSLVGDYNGICMQVGHIMRKVQMKEVLDRAWEFTADFDTLIVPRPLDKPYHGDGPKIGKTSVSLIGPGRIDGKPTFDDENIRHLIAHERSHSYAEVIKEQIMEIAEERGIADQINAFASEQKARNYFGMTVLVETMMRAMQTRYIDPHLDLRPESPRSIDRILIDEHEWGGFEHIFKFDRAIRGHKEHPRGTLAEDIVNSLYNTSSE